MRRAVGFVRSRRQVRRAVRQARKVSRSHPAAVRVCWDLDNTLVGSGQLLRAGMPLHEAIVDALPVPNMPAFYDSMRLGLPHARHFILSARTSSMRPDTLAWLDNHGLPADEATICFVPHVEAKLKVWRQLARDARLVVVDDLSYDHEAAYPSIYEDLVVRVEQIAFIYIGMDRIAQIAASAAAAEKIASEVVEALVGAR